MEELYYYNFKPNRTTGGFIENNSLINRKYTINHDFTLDWQKKVQYGKVDITEDEIKAGMRVNKPSQMERNLSGIQRDEIEIEDTLAGVENLTEIETYFLTDGSQHYTDYIELKIDWHAVHLPKEDTGEVTLSTDDGEYVTLRLFNRSKMEFEFFNGDEVYTTQIIETHPDSTANISHILSNDVNDLKLSVRLTDYDINVQISSHGIKSKWITREFSSNKLTHLFSCLPYDSDHTAKELTLYDISMEGFYNKRTYMSETIELDGEENDITSVTLDGEVIDQIPISDETNTPVLNVDVAENKDDLEPDSGKQFTMDEATGDFILAEDIDDEFGGNYMQFSITNTTSKHHQNSIDYVLFKYEIEEERIYDFPEISATKEIGSEGGAISLNDIFDSKLFIPPGALDANTEITMTLLGSDDDRIPPNSIAYEFEPDGITFNEEVLLSIDYSNFIFDKYSTEEGLSVIHVQNYNTEDSREVDSTVFKERHRVVSYLEHFSTYFIQPTDDQYSDRTDYHAREFPSWMKLQEKDSVFQQLDNYTLSQQLDKLQKRNDYAQLQKFIDTADTDQKYISFTVPVSEFEDEDGNKLEESLDTQTKAIYKGKEYHIVFDQVEFFTRNDNVFYYDTEKKLLHFPRPFGNELKILHDSNYHYINEGGKLTENHIWNSFDEIGLLMGIERLPRESNKDFKTRILNVRKYIHGANRQGMRNAVRNLILGQSSRIDDELKKRIEKISI